MSVSASLDQKPPQSISSTSTPFLVARDLVKTYGKRRVVNGVHIQVFPGEVVGLLGPNGAGKTTTFYMLVGLIPAEEGIVLFGGQDVTRLPMYQRARLGMGYLSQEPSIFRNMTVWDNIMAVLETLNIPSSERKKRASCLLEAFGLIHLKDQKARTLSGGERRRLEIARTLTTNPKVIMLDEPFSGVDPKAVYEVQQIIRQLKALHLGILITDHNVRETLEIVDRGYIIHQGTILCEGTSEFLIHDPQAREVYLGPAFKK